MKEQRYAIRRIDGKYLQYGDWYWENTYDFEEGLSTESLFTRDEVERVVNDLSDTAIIVEEVWVETEHLREEKVPYAG